MTTTKIDNKELDYLKTTSKELFSSYKDKIDRSEDLDKLKADYVKMYRLAIRGLRNEKETQSYRLQMAAKSAAYKKAIEYIEAIEKIEIDYDELSKSLYESL